MTDDDSIARLQRRIDGLTERLDALEASVDASSGGGRARSMTRRTLLGSAGLLGAVGLATGTVAADAQGQVGTDSDPVKDTYVQTVRASSGAGLTVNVDDTATSLVIEPGGSDVADESSSVSAPNLVAGHPDNNTNSSTPSGVTVAGGGSHLNAHTASADYATIGGGEFNTASAQHSTVGGGESNRAYGAYSTAGGGQSNIADRDWSTIAGGSGNDTDAQFAAVGGGNNNVASGKYATIAGGNVNEATAKESTVAGGDHNDATGSHSTVGGGDTNTASGADTTVAGGTGNSATTNAATVGGGQSNTASGIQATVAGGHNNEATGTESAVGGGNHNKAAAQFATVAGGGPSDTTDSTTRDNTRNVVYDDYGTIGGGGNNQAGSNDGTSNDIYATVPGGRNNTADGAYSFAAGRAASTNGNDGAFVWGDSSTTSVTAQAADEIRFQATGGFVISTGLTAGSGNTVNIDSSTGELLDATASSARYKTNIEPLTTDTAPVLDLEPKAFDYEETGDSGVGFIAEEVDETFPDLVVYDEAGRPDGVEYDRLPVYMLQEVREHRDRLDAFEETLATESDRVDDLEGDVDDLRAENGDLQSAIDDLRAENERLRTENDDLRAENDRLRERVEAIEAHLGLDGGDDAAVADD